ncbi:MAG: hypothetical protein CMJ18_15195 [Phycisphaeraceae bacterium]|nr:hypothetical protein [Phycisphaeraceae bacterium]
MTGPDIDTAMDQDDALEMDDSDKTLSLMGGVGTDEGGIDQDGFGSERSRKRISQSTVLIVMVVVISAGGFFLMRVSQSEADFTAQISDDVAAIIEQALARHANSEQRTGDDPLRKENIEALLGDTDAFISMFTSDHADLQVPITMVQKNPFILKKKVESPKPKPAKIRTEDQRERQRKETLKRLSREAERLKLQTVMGGRTPMAIVSGEMVKAGQKLGSFTVLKIGERTVELAAGGTTFILVMDK